MNNQPTTTNASATMSPAEYVKQSFNFTVDKFPLTGPDCMPTGVYGMFRSDTCEMVGRTSVTKAYKAHTADDVALLVDAASHAFPGDTRHVKCVFNHGHVVSLAPSDRHRASIYGTKDNIFPRLIIDAGYGGSAFKASLGLYRDACDNLQMMQSLNKTSVSIRHSTSLHSRVESLSRTFRSLAEQWAGVVNVVQAMQAKSVDFAEFLSRVYPVSEDATGRSRTIAVNRTREIFNRFMRERVITERPTMASGHQVSVWEAFNAVQGHAQHDKVRRGQSRDASHLERAMVAAEDPAVKLAERLSMELIAA